MARPPLPALALGASGLLPAFAACVAVLMGPVEWRASAATVCATYAAIILSFLGGAWWGLASRGDGGHWPRPPVAVFAASVLPSLAAWGALLLDRMSGLMLLGLLFLAVLPGDAWLARGGLAPAWWLSLRVPLSLGMAALAVVAGAACGLG